MISKEKLQFLAQLIQAMQDSTVELEKSIQQGDLEKTKKIKDFLLNLQKRVDEFTTVTINDGK